MVASALLVKIGVVFFPPILNASVRFSNVMLAAVIAVFMVRDLGGGGCSRMLTAVAIIYFGREKAKNEQSPFSPGEE